MENLRVSVTAKAECIIDHCKEKKTDFFHKNCDWTRIWENSAGQLVFNGAGRPPRVVCGLIGWECPPGQVCWLAHSHVQAVFGSVHPLQLLKVFPSITDIDESCCRCWKNIRHCFFYKLIWFLKCLETSHLLLTDGGVWHDDHDVRVGGEDVNEGCKIGVPHFHALEWGCKFAAIEKKRKNLKCPGNWAGDVWNETYLQLSLNCLIMLLIFSNLWISRCSLHW